MSLTKNINIINFVLRKICVTIKLLDCDPSHVHTLILTPVYCRLEKTVLCVFCVYIECHTYYLMSAQVIRCCIHLNLFLMQPTSRINLWYFYLISYFIHLMMNLHSCIALQYISVLYSHILYEWGYFQFISCNTQRMAFDVCFMYGLFFV